MLYCKKIPIIDLHNCIPEKRGHYGSCMVINRIRRDFLVFNLQASFLLGFLLNFASGFLWQRSGHSILLVAQESKLCSGDSKTSKKFDYCLCSSCRVQFLSDLLCHQHLCCVAYRDCFVIQFCGIVRRRHTLYSGQYLKNGLSDFIQIWHVDVTAPEGVLYSFLP